MFSILEVDRKPRRNVLCLLITLEWIDRIRVANVIIFTQKLNNFFQWNHLPKFRVRVGTKICVIKVKQIFFKFGKKYLEFIVESELIRDVIKTKVGIIIINHHFGLSQRLPIWQR